MKNSQKKRIINFRPFLYLAVMLACGILFGYFYYFKEYLFLFLVIFCISALNILYLIFSKDNFKLAGRFIFVFVSATVFFIGAFSFTAKLNNYKAANLNDMYLQVDGTVKEVIDGGELQKVILTDIKVSGAENKVLDYDMNLYITNGKAKIGNRLVFKTNVGDYKEKYSQKFASQNIVDDVKYYARVDYSDIDVYDGDGNLLQIVKQAVDGVLESGLDREDYLVAHSLLLGKNDVIDDNVLQSFNNTGVAHIFAVSGLHIGFLAVAVSFIMKKLKVNKYIGAFLTIAVLFFYSGVCGFTASSIRAVIMSAVLILANLSGKKYDFASAISIAFLIILFYSPVQLFCLGFQLSFLAITGIMLFGNLFSRVFFFLPNKIRSAVSASLSAQLFTLPLLIYYFKNVSVISLFVNIIFVPIVSVVFILLFVCVILSIIFNLPKIFLFLPSFIIKGMRYAVSFFDRKFFLVSLFIVGISFLIYYVVCILLSGIVNVKKKVRIITTSVLLCSFIAINVYGKIQEEKYTYVNVIANESVYSTVIEEGGKYSVVVNMVSPYFYPNKLINFLEEGEIENLFIVDNGLSSKSLNSVITKFNYYFKLNKVYVLDEGIIQYLDLMFNGITFLPIVEGGEVKTEHAVLTTYKNANAVKISKSGKNVLLLSRLAGSENPYDNLTCNNALCVFTQYSLGLREKLKAEKYIEYGRESNGYSCILDGNYKIKI